MRSMGGKTAACILDEITNLHQNSKNAISECVFQTNARIFADKTIKCKSTFGLINITIRYIGVG